MKIRQEGDRLTFYCPGCERTHSINITWDFNQNFDRPTIQPSILVRSGHYLDGKDSCWCTFNEEHKDDPAPFICFQCHSFITDGMIIYLSDSTHHLAGKTVELPEL